jgi:hypothetical protein
MLVYWYQDLIDTDWSGPVPKAFIYWYGWDRTVPLLVRVEIGPDRFKSGSVELPNSGSTKWYWNGSNCWFIRTDPNQIKMARTNK